MSRWVPVMVVVLGMFAVTVAFRIVHAENRALLIGVGAYQVGQRLPGIENDINTIWNVAHELGYNDADIRVLRDADADLAGIQQAIENWLIKGTGPGDQALLYFSGHGSQIGDTSGDEIDGADEVLLPYDVKLQGRQLENALSDDAFGKMLARIPADRIVVLIDACHSGTVTKKLRGAPGVVEKFFYYPGMPMANEVFAIEKDSAVSTDHFLAISACQDDEKALATPDGSLFTQGLADAVATCRRTQRPVTAAAIKALAAQYIQNHRPGSAPAHHPHLSGNQVLLTADLTLSDNRPVRSQLWQQLKDIAGGATGAIAMQTNRQHFQIGQDLTISCRVPYSGYLNIINLGEHDRNAVVLFPNRFHRDNAVKANAEISIPGPGDPFHLPARAPGGKTLLIALLTQTPINAFQDGTGDLDALFRQVSEKSLRSFAVEENMQPSKLGAAVLEVIIAD